MKIRFRTRFTPPMVIDLDSRTTKDEQGADVSGTLLAIVQPEIGLATGVGQLDTLATVAPGGRPGDWRPWAVGAAIVAGIAAYAILRKLG